MAKNRGSVLIKVIWNNSGNGKRSWLTSIPMWIGIFLIITIIGFILMMNYPTQTWKVAQAVYSVITFHPSAVTHKLVDP